MEIRNAAFARRALRTSEKCRQHMRSMTDSKWQIMTTWRTDTKMSRWIRMVLAWWPWIRTWCITCMQKDQSNTFRNWKNRRGASWIWSQRRLLLKGLWWTGMQSKLQKKDRTGLVLYLKYRQFFKPVRVRKCRCFVKLLKHIVFYRKKKIYYRISTSKRLKKLKNYFRFSNTWPDYASWGFDRKKRINHEVNHFSNLCEQRQLKRVTGRVVSVLFFAKGVAALYRLYSV